MKKKKAPTKFFAESKGEKTKQRIIEATMKSVAKNGFEGTSVTTICDIAKVNRGLVVHYFKDVRELFLLTADYVIKTGQLEVQDLLVKHSYETDPVEGYIKAMTEWHKKQNDKARCLLLLYVVASHNKDYHRIMTKVVETGSKRMFELIEVGKQNGQYSKGIQSKEIGWILYTQIWGVFLLSFVEKKNTTKHRDDLIDLKNYLLKP